MVSNYKGMFGEYFVGLCYVYYVVGFCLFNLIVIEDVGVECLFVFIII